MNKLTIAEAHKITLQAQQQVALTPTYRLGQAIWNLLPKELAEYDQQNNPDHYKFYNSLDMIYCIKYTWENLVEFDEG